MCDGITTTRGTKVDMHGREVTVYHLTSYPLIDGPHINCSDCGEIATALIVEKDSKIWAYCGV